ncbi:MAG: tRNA pseudouridine(38-40) synthase TruA, partial [Ignavibacteriaceae bacterium]|nr:tRNA pseudouridine(38-40) synthase TruA [Ignavibacteriaceae bacterium]
MKNYKITVQYSGTNYSGWQIQQNAKSVQGLLSNAINTVLRDNISLVGAGRTDAGVHAIGQCANFRTEKNIVAR